jgi:hypothetical protein
MPWKNLNGEESLFRPNRVRLPNSETRTAEEVTDEVLAEAGWSWEEPVITIAPPVVDLVELITLTGETIEEPIDLGLTMNISVPIDSNFTSSMT